MQPVAVVQKGVVDLKVLQDLEYCKWSAGKETLLFLLFVEETDILVHVEEISMREPLHILFDGHNLLEILILTIAAEDGVIHDDTVNLGIFVGVEYMLFQLFTVDLSQFKLETAGKESALLLTRDFMGRKMEKGAYFCLAVFPVHSAYTRAASSELARKPTRSGFLPISFNPS